MIRAIIDVREMPPLANGKHPVSIEAQDLCSPDCTPLERAHVTKLRDAILSAMQDFAKERGAAYLNANPSATAQRNS